MFKQYPSCGLTQTSTQGILELIKETDINPDNVLSISVRVQPFTQGQVGDFVIADSPRQNAKFSIPYCVANALLRKNSQLINFDEASIRDPKILEIIDKITVIASPDMESRDETSMEMEVRTKEGDVYHKSVDTPRGFPGNEMTREEHISRFRQCLQYGATKYNDEHIQKIISTIDKLEEVSDVRSIITLIQG